MPSFRFFLRGDLQNTINKVFAELLETKFADNLLSALIELALLTGKDLPHAAHPILFGLAQISTALTNRLPRPATVVSDDGNSRIHGFARNNTEVLILGGIEDAFCIPKQIFSCFVADRCIKMDVVHDIQLFGQLL